MNYNVRIDDNFLKADHSDGEVLQHTDLNELESVVKTAINANYLDIQKLEDGTISVAGATSLKGTDGVATLSQLINENLQPSDSKIPTSLQVKSFVENVVNTANTGLVFYWDGTGGQEGANIFNQICSKYDNNGKFVFYGRFSVDVGYDKPSGEHVEILRDVIAPIIVNKLTDRQTGNIDYLSFSFPPIFLGDKYAICSIQLTGNWGNFTDVRQMTWSDSMAPAMVKDTNSVNNLEFTGDYSSGATSGNIALTEDDANALKNKLFSVNPGKSVTLKTNINGTVNLLGELTEHTIENDNMYYNIDFMELGQYASYKVTVKAHFTKTLLEGVEVWENDVEYTKMYITAFGGDGGNVVETNPSMTGADLYTAIVDTKLKVGTTALCTTDYENNGTTFKAGHTYLITGTFTNSKLTLDYTDLSTVDFYDKKYIDDTVGNIQTLLEAI